MFKRRMPASTDVKQNASVKSSDKGSAAIEFALVAPAFFLLFLAIFDMGAFFLIRMSMELAVYQASRYGRTTGGSSGQTGALEAAALVSQYTFGLVIPTLTVTAYGSFSSMPSLSQAPSNGTQNFGAANQPVMYTLSYNYKFFTPIVGAFFTNGQFPIVASAVVENEPF